MGIIGHPSQWLKPWYLGALAAAAVVASLATYGAFSFSGGSDQPGQPVNRQVALAQQQGQRMEIPVKGRLAFPNRVELTFDTDGKVGQILVADGDSVVRGQVLARLDDLTVTALEENLARARFDLDQAQDTLERAKEEFLTTPLQRAEFEAEISQARQDVNDAEERLADFQRDYQQDLAEARKAKADSEVALDDAQETLDDFQRDTNRNLARALMTNVDAELAMDNAAEQLNFYQRDQAQDLANARQEVSEAEDALDAAEEALADFDAEYAAALADTRLAVADAENSLEVAEDTLTDFIVSLGNTRVFGEDEVEELERLQTEVEEADTNLVQANTGLAELAGNRSLFFQGRQAAVATTQANLFEAQDGVEELEDELDQLLEFQLRQAAAVMAQADLDQAQKDLKDELAGPDPLVLRKLEAAVEANQAELAQAEFDLAKEMFGPDTVELAFRQKELAKSREVLIELVNGPDLFDVAVKEAAVASAQAQVDDALDELAGVTVRAPFEGIIRLVNVDLDDLVTDESRVIEMVDPSRVEVEGLVDAADIRLVKELAKAKVRISPQEDQEFGGVVTRVSAQPRTERGVVSYPITISVEIPEALQITLELAAVSTVVIYEPEQVS